MARVVVAAAAAVAYAYFSGDVSGSLQVFALVYGVSAGLDPNKKVQGPRLDDLKAPTANEGIAVPYIEGSQRYAGVYVWYSSKREVAHEQSQGKGGPGVDTTTFTYEMDCLVMLSANPMAALRRVWSNGKLVWSAAIDDQETLDASEATNSWGEIRFYTGDLAQLPDPDYEAAVGVGNAPAYRGRSTVFIKSLNLGGSGQLPVLNFEVVSQADTEPTDATVLLQPPFFADAHDISAYETPYTLNNSPIIGDQYLTTGNGENVYYTNVGNFDDLADQGMTIECYALAGAGLDDGTVYRALSLDAGGGTDVGVALVGTAKAYIDYGAGLPPQMIPPPPPETEAYGTHLALVIPAGGTPTMRLYANGKFLYSQIAAAGISGLLGVRAGSEDDFVTDENYKVGGVRVTRGERYVADFTPPQLPLPDPDAGSEVVTPIDPTLDQVVKRLCLRTGGLLESDLDVTDLEGTTVRGFAVSNGTTRQAIDILQAAYLFESVEGEKLKFVRRGGAPALTIPFEDLGAGDEADSTEALPLQRSNDSETPARVSVKFSNYFNDYQDGTAQSDRLVTSSASTVNVEIPLVLTPTEAAKIADVQTNDLQASLVTVGPVQVSRKYAALEPTDVVLAENFDGSLFRCRIMKLTDSGGKRILEMLLDDASVIDSEASRSDEDQSTVLVRGVSDTLAMFLDIPILRDGDSDPGFYAVMKPTDPAKRWPGGAIFSSADGVSFSDTEQQAIQRAIFGPCVTVLGDFDGGYVFDEVNTLRVSVIPGTLSSSTNAALIADETINACAIGTEQTGWELIQFRTATLVDTGIYDLTGLLRGRKGTEWRMASHEAGEYCVLLTVAGTVRVPVDTGQINVERTYKTPTLGQSLAGAEPKEFTDTAVGLKPWSPVDLRAEVESGTTTITWKRRTRLHASLSVIPLGEFEEAYDVVVGDSDPIATYRVNAPEWSTTDDLSGLSVTVYQVSATVGRGYPAEIQL